MAQRMKPPEILGELSAEFAGTMILILFGAAWWPRSCRRPATGRSATTTASPGPGASASPWASTSPPGSAAPTSTPRSPCRWPLFKGFPWRKVGPYSLAQTAGAFVAALLVRWNYTEVLAKPTPGHTIKTQFVFSTLPGNGALPVSSGARCGTRSSAPRSCCC